MDIHEQKNIGFVFMYRVCDYFRGTSILSKENEIRRSIQLNYRD
jgi:hypothetical protein